MFNLSESQTVLVFRLSICILLMGLELLACLVGKLLRERSSQFFNYFYALCGGILLAKGMFCELFESISSGKINSIGYSLFLFSFSFVVLAAINMALRSSSYQYQQLSNSEVDDEEESSGIELGSFPITDDEGEKERVVSPSIIEKSTKLNLFWSYCIISMVLLAEGANGLLIGYSEHADLLDYSKIFSQGILLCLACGAILEDTVSDPIEFARSLILVISALPLGMIVGNYVVFLLALTSRQVLSYLATVFPIAAGFYTAGAVTYMIPFDREDTTAKEYTGGSSSNNCLEMLMTTSSIRAMLLVTGFALTAWTVNF